MELKVNVPSNWREVSTDAKAENIAPENRVM